MILEVPKGKAWLDVARVLVQANKIEQVRGGSTSFPEFLFFSLSGAREEREEERSWELG